MILDLTKIKLYLSIYLNDLSYSILRTEAEEKNRSKIENSLIMYNQKESKYKESKT